MKELIEKIGLEKELKAKLLNLLKNDENKILSIAEKCRKNGFKSLYSKDDLTKLAVVIAYTKYTKEQYKKLNISDDIFYATMNDISIWCQNDNNNGLKNISWIKNHLECNLFKIGRLQYQLYTCNINLDYNMLPFEKDEKMIYVHIPQGEKLDYSKCLDSLRDAKEFFKEHFPDWKYRFFFCESWLLYRENWQFMKPSSNILQFQSLFNIVYSCKNDKQAIERIFGKRHIIKPLYPTNTSLQQSARKYMLKGGKLGLGIGIIHIDEI